MQTASQLRASIEATLADRIPGALTPATRTVRPVAPIGIESLDALLGGGLPVGAITEIVGAESSGRTSLAVAFVARMTIAGKVCAWIDVSNTLQPDSAAANGIELERLLWVRCGVTSESKAEKSNAPVFALPEKYLAAPATVKGLHGGGCGTHPRGEMKGLPESVGGFLRPAVTPPRSAEPLGRVTPVKQTILPDPVHISSPLSTSDTTAQSKARLTAVKPLSRIDQALRVTDLLLQAGGFGALVLDMGSIEPEHALRVPMATWFRYRAAAERSQTSILLLTQHACAKSSAALLLNLRMNRALRDEATIFTGMEPSVEVSRERFAPSASNILPMRKPPVGERGAYWQSRTTWMGNR